MIKQIVRLLIATGVGIILLTSFVFIINHLSKKSQHIPFHSQEWKNDTSVCAFYFGGDRKKMFKNLQKILTESQFNKQKITELLGKPKLQQSKNLWSYHSGTSTMDCLSFDITFDQNGFVIDSQLIQH
jgi:hypothetical protein